MYFKRLELVGFKSFMDKTILNFEPGVTAIVGPNGCGKSNIFDSIRWVLGEQSVKSLRGSSMEDVIFNGTDTKQALGMAEVSLTFDNGGKHFSVDSEEVTITRRIFRSGESEYLLNRAQCRLKDINDLLLGTGIGAESYSIVAQGKIDMILSSRPEDRRMVFDEASGITKYKSQKREALRKLEETDQNLLRINDIITEVKRSIGYLERQANKARRYQATFEELKTKELTQSVIQKNILIRQNEEIIRQLDSLKVQEEALQAQIRQQESDISQHSEDVRSLEEKIASLKSGLVDAENNIERNKQHIVFNQERIKEQEETRLYLENQLIQTQQRLALEQEKLAKLKEEEALLKSGIAEKTGVLAVNETRLDQIIQGIKISIDAIASAKKMIMELATRISQVKNELTELVSKHHVHDARKKRLELEKAKIGEEKSQVEASLASLAGELTQLERQFQEIVQQVEGLKKELENQTQAHQQLNTELESLERQRLALLSQKEFLEKLKSQYEDISESMNAEILLDKLPSEKISGLVVKVSDYEHMQPQGQELLGTQRFRFAGEAKPIDLDAQKVIERLAQVESQLVVVREQKVQLEARLQQLNASIQMLSERQQAQELSLGNKRTVHHTVLEQYNKVKEEEDIVVLELSDVETELANLAQKQTVTQEHLQALERQNIELDVSIHSEQENINVQSRLKEDVLVIIAQVKTELENLNRRLSSEDTTLAELEESCRQAQNTLDELIQKANETDERKKALAAEIIDLEEAIIRTSRDIEEKKRTLSEEEQRFGVLSSAIDEIVKGIDARRSSLADFKDQSYQIQMTQKDVEFKYQTLKERISTHYKIDLDSLVAAKPQPVQEPVEQTVVEAQDQEAQPAAEQSQEQAPAGDLQPQQDSATNEPAQQPTTVVIDDNIDENVLAEEIQRLKDRIDSYGTVNLVAIAEYDELKKRYDFLTQQQTDLLTAKEQLQDAIRKINMTTRKMFLETFEQVREQFRNYFKLLFNGGDAQIYLIDENDPLESGIEIICRPPGKKLQNVLLLSGGEKSLSAIALIFSIFKVKPAPFCILDEIDAALDEANVERFSRMFSEFTGTSQFIVITHNKRTIANANVMYGITMQESGVSRIVSVKLAEDKPKEKKVEEPVAA